MANDLHLHEQVMLLALHDQKGTATGYWSYAVGGAILAELLLAERIGIEERGRRAPLVDLVSRTQLGDPVLDEALDRIRTAKRRASTTTWVSRFAASRDLKHRLGRRLSQRGILRIEEDRVMLVFTRRLYPELDPDPERRLIERMRDAIMGDDEDVEPRTVLLIALADGAGLLKGVLDRRELKARKERIRALREGDVAGRATRAAIEAADAALIATTAAVSAATAASIPSS